MARGDHIRVGRFLYRHHGIDCGDGSVIHYTGTLWKRKDARVSRTPLGEFLGRYKGNVRIVRHPDSASPDEIMERAEGRLDERRYSLLFNNCEHFATWCVTGIATSKQVRRAAKTVAVSAAAIVIGGVLVIVGKKAGGRVGA